MSVGGMPPFDTGFTCRASGARRGGSLTDGLLMTLTNSPMTCLKPDAWMMFQLCKRSDLDSLNSSRQRARAGLSSYVLLPSVTRILAAARKEKKSMTALFALYAEQRKWRICLSIKVLWAPQRSTGPHQPGK
jgi:hypothetical protein